MAPPRPPADEDLLVSGQPFTRRANQRAQFAGPSQAAPGRRDPEGAGSASLLPPPGGRLRGGGRGGGGGWRRVWRFKNGGGGGGTAHLVPLPGGCSGRAAPAGGCRRQPPAFVVASSSTQVSPGSPPPKVRGCSGPTEPRTLPSGVCPRPAGVQVFAEPDGGAGTRGEVRTGAGTWDSFPLHLPQQQPLSIPCHRGPGEALREGERERAATFQRLRPGLGKLQRVPAPRVPRGARWPKTAWWGPWAPARCLPAPRPPPFPAASRARTCAPTRTPSLAGPRSARSNSAVSVGAVADAAAGGRYQDGEGRALPRLGARAGSLRDGRRSLTFLGPAVSGRAIQASALCAACASLGNFSGTRCCDLVPPLLEMKLAYRVASKP